MQGLNKNKGKKVVLGFSGSPYSVLVAKILKEQGMHIFAYHFMFDISLLNIDACSYKHEYVSAMAKRMGVDLNIVNIKDRFKADVIDRYVADRIQGNKSSPCFLCKIMILKQLYEYSLKMGADYIATSLFAKVSPQNDILRYKDEKYDQSLLIAFSEIPVQKFILPLGNMLSRDIERLIRALDVYSEDEEFKLNNVNHTSCLSNKQTLQILSEQIPVYLNKNGYVKDIHEYLIGSHSGIFLSSIGERINYKALKNAKPVFSESSLIIDIKAEENLLVVGDESCMYKEKAIINDIKWFREPELFRPREMILFYDNGNSDRAVVYYAIDNAVRIEFTVKTKNPSRGKYVCLLDNGSIIACGRISSPIIEEIYI